MNFLVIYVILSAMRCPVCSNLLQQVKTKSAVLDVCPNCKGVWFDSEKLADFVKSLSQSDRISPKETKLFERIDVQTLRDIEEKDKFCPRCNQKMHKFNYSYDSNIFLDKCSECEGIWTDSGEAQAIAKYLKEDPKITVVGKGLAEQVQTLEDLKDLQAVGRELTQPVSAIVLFFPRIIVPLSDDTPRERFPLVTVSIIMLCALTFVGQILWVSDPEAFVQKFGFISGDFFSLGLVTSMFLHGGIFHLIFNMFFLWLFGDNVEDRFTRFGFILFYFACGLFASILHSVFNWGSTIPAIGASGAISGVMGAYCVFYPTARIKLFFIYRILHVPAFLYLGGWFFLQLIAGFLSKAVIASNIAFFAHIGGFVFGAIVAYLKKRAIRVREQT